MTSIMFGRETAKRTVFEPPKDESQTYYQKDLADPLPLRDIPITINSSAHVTCFEKMNEEQKMMPGPGYYNLERTTEFKRPQSALHMPATVVGVKESDGREYLFDIKQFRKISESTVCHSFNTSDRWKTGHTAMDRFLIEQKRAKLQTSSRKRSKFCQ